MATDMRVNGREIPAHIVEVWQHVVNSISELLALPSVMINRLDPPELEVFRSNLGPDNPLPSGTRMAMAGVYCEMAARKRQRVQVVDAREDPEWCDSPTAKAGVYAYLGFPLEWPDGEVFGTLCAVDMKANEWGEKYETMLRTCKETIEMHLALVMALDSLDRKNRELEQALSEVKTLQGLLPICASCKKIRDDEGYWNQLEIYLKKHAGVKFSHSLCPECEKHLYPELDGVG
ncbi:MAG: GAF domain-containing protein [Thermoleophilia bacterium]|nr:GAF domain-containing protein [Thermoleophilia bacterium]